MQAVLESREIRDIARQMKMNLEEGYNDGADKKTGRGVITSYEISQITGEVNCKVSDKIRRLLPRGREYYYDTIFTSKSNATFKAVALTEKGLAFFIEAIEGMGNRCTKKQLENIRKIKEAVGLLEEPRVEEVRKPIRMENMAAAQKGKEQKIREAVDNLVIADSFINVVEERFIGRDYENLTYQERDDFERLFYFMADQLHSRIGVLKVLVES